MKKGFTLIELLAVIVILAIIALIATPMILNIIGDAKEESNKRSIDLYAQAVKNAVASYQLKENKTPINFSDIENYIKYDGSEVECETKKLNSDGTIFLDDCEINGEKVEYTYGKAKKKSVCIRATKLHTEECTDSWGCTTAGYTISGSKSTTTITHGNLGTAGVLASGDAFDCDVNGDGIYNSESERFYYVSSYYNGYTNTFDNSIAVLIYYSNTIKGIPDNMTNAHVAYDFTYSVGGPATGVVNLPTSEQWSNISLSNEMRQITTELGGTTTPKGDKISSFNYSGYATRLLTTQELEKACNITVGSMKMGELDDCIYLLENTRFSSDSISTEAYALENLHDTYLIWNVPWHNRYVGQDTTTNNGTTAGVRPVIEVPLSDIDY